MSVSDRRLRDAAIVVAALDPHVADALLEQMPEEQSAQLRRAMIELDRVDDGEQRRLIEQFVRGTPHRALADEEGAVQLELSAASQAPVLVEPVPTVLPRDPNLPSPLHTLLQTDPQRLAEILSDEHPQTIAVIISDLPPERGFDLLARLPESSRVEILPRVASLGETDPEILLEIRQAIGAKLGPRPTDHGAGIATLRSILAVGPPSQRDAILSGLAHTHRELANVLGYSPGSSPLAKGPAPSEASGMEETPNQRDPEAEAPQQLPTREAGESGCHGELPARAAPSGDQSPPTPSSHTPRRQPRFRFEDFVDFDSQSLAAVFGQAEPECAILALTGASRKLVDRLLGQLPSRQARRVRQQMHRLGPVRLRDIERAQEKLALLASRLYHQGIIQPPLNARAAATVVETTAPPYSTETCLQPCRP